MTGSINPNLPSAGESRGTSDSKVKGSLITLRDEINALLTSENKLDPTKIPDEGISSAKLEPAARSALKWYTPKIISGEEGVSTGTFTTLTTPDEIQNVVVATNALVLIGYSALAKYSTGEGRAAIFIGSNQLKASSTTAPVVQESTLQSSFTEITTCPFGLHNATTSGTSFVTTGMALAAPVGEGGFCVVQRLAAGTYNISVKYKRGASGTVSAKERALWVATLG